MATVMKTPGVYIVEKDAFPNSVVEVPTAIPAFVGYTEWARDREGKDLPQGGDGAAPPVAVPIASMLEYERHFGKGPELQFKLEGEKNDEPELIEANRFYLYYSMRLFFDNGGGRCFVVSVGSYENGVSAGALEAGIGVLVKESEPTMLVVPDAMRLEAGEAAIVQKAALTHCGSERLRDRVAILDVPGGHDLTRGTSEMIRAFREGVSGSLDFGAAYFPWVDTTLVEERDLSSKQIVQGFELSDWIEKHAEEIGELDDEQMDGLLNEDDPTNALLAISPSFKNLIKRMRKEVNRLPPSGAMAGVWARVDASRGVWKAPANVGINGVLNPTIQISHEEQEDLNVPLNGKAVNAIRSFVGDGTRVWGARTLDGNSLDWRYISVRRTMIMLEQSIKIAAKAFVFEANDAKTWVTMKSMIRNFLTGIWKRGGLAGASPDEAFTINVGLGETMTSVDILEGILKITVGVAVTRPAEFIEITFQQQQQTS